MEFHAGQTAVLRNAVPWHAATNFAVSAVAGDGAGECPRYDTLVRRLPEADGTLDSGAALGLLQAVAQTERATQWSVVDGMSTGTVEVAMGPRCYQTPTFQLTLQP